MMAVLRPSSTSASIQIVLGLILLLSTATVLAFAPIRGNVGTCSNRWAALGVHGSNPLDAGSGIYYDADPTRMERAAAAAADAAQSRAGIQRSDESVSTSTSSSSSPSPAATSAGPLRSSSTRSVPKDVLIIGSGLAGLSAALHIATTAPDRHVTILEREDPAQQRTKTTAGSFAAAGMLAPQSERLPQGPLLDLCLRSREMYPDFVESVEDWARNSGEEGRRHLWRDGDDNRSNEDGESGQQSSHNLQPWEVGFTAAGGFLAPAFAGDSVATWAPPSQSGTARWLDAVQVRELEPQLHQDVVGGWWFPEDASVDARRLTCSLRAACLGAGVQFMCGKDCEATSLELSGGTCRGVRLADGRNLAPKSILVANGSWMRNLLPVPVVPHKGQSFSVRMPPNTPPILSRVLFAQDTYIVPKADGRVVIGATVEAGSFDPNVTPAGLMHCMANAAQLVPAIADLPIEETWAGLRPTTPDKGPILGQTPWDNLYLAGGYWRNGVLLAPKTGQMIGDLITGNLNEEDEALIAAFSWDRFTAPGGGDKLAADARYAASMHPVHRRSSGVGVSAAVGTELGFYSGAGDAKDERAKDRSSLFDDFGASDTEENAFEKAAMLGKGDAVAFTFGDDVAAEARAKPEKAVLDEPIPDAYTVGASDEGGELALKALYSQYRSQIDEVKEEAMKAGDLVPTEETMDVEDSTPKGEAAAADDDDEYDETTYDGYQAILKDDWGQSKAELREKMRKSRIQNRMKASSIDESKIGAVRMEDATTQTPAEASNDISSVYEKIKANKEAAAAEGVEMQEADPSDRPDPGFRIYRVDPDTREVREVPPYTKFQDMEDLVAAEKKGKDEDESQDVSTPQDAPAIENTAGVDEDIATELETSSAEEDYTEETYDGYQAILKDDWGASEAELREKMRKSRIQNRMKASSIDESKIGAMSAPDDEVAQVKNGKDAASSRPQATTETVLKLEQPDLSSVYDKIISNKKKEEEKGLEMQEATPDDRPDPGFRIYRVDSETGEAREVPPYTSPGAMDQLIADEKKESSSTKEAEKI